MLFCLTTTTSMTLHNTIFHIHVIIIVSFNIVHYYYLILKQNMLKYCYYQLLQKLFFFNLRYDNIFSL